MLFLLNCHFLLFQLTEIDSSPWLLPHGVQFLIGCVCYLVRLKRSSTWGDGEDGRAGGDEDEDGA